MSANGVSGSSLQRQSAGAVVVRFSVTEMAPEGNRPGAGSNDPRGGAPMETLALAGGSA